jgi:four helix bundle protein
MNRFFQIAMGSASETEYLLLLGKELDYISQKDCSDLSERIIEVKKMLATLIKKLNADH